MGISASTSVGNPAVSITPAPSCFIGYDRLDGDSTVLAIYANGSGKQEAVEGEQVDIVTAETPFYGESGGQVGDRGTIQTSRGDILEVVDTQHPTPQLTAHCTRIKRGRIQVGDQVQLSVDPKHRQKTMTQPFSHTHTSRRLAKGARRPRSAGRIVGDP